jgi:hypothetical protein
MIFLSLLIQSMIVPRVMCFWIKILLHGLSLVIIFHNDFATRDCPNKSISFRPHPPNSFAATIFLQFTLWVPLYSLLPYHNKLKYYFPIFSKIPFGIWARVCQYIRLASNANSIRTKQHPLDNYLLHHCEILLSAFMVSQY